MDKILPFPNKKYQIIYADPPWRYGVWGNTALWLRPNSKKRPLPFPAMSIDEICALPVWNITDDNCELYLWTTQKYLPDSFRVIRAWGFQYKQTLVWCKKPRCGLGGAYTPTNEFLLLARKGKKPKAKRILTTWFLVKRPHNHHSEKPAFFRDMIKSITPEPRIELFARQKTEGWDVWGNEV
jgi:site-specific DNA-methyltransferase (adenine-specific)